MELFECFFLRDDATVEEVEENEADVETPHCPAKDELLESIEVLAKFSLCSNQGDEIQSQCECSTLEKSVEEHFSRRPKIQLSILDFFSLEIFLCNQFFNLFFL